MQLKFQKFEKEGGGKHSRLLSFFLEHVVDPKLRLQRLELLVVRVDERDAVISAAASSSFVRLLECANEKGKAKKKGEEDQTCSTKHCSSGQ